MNPASASSTDSTMRSLSIFSTSCRMIPSARSSCSSPRVLPYFTASRTTSAANLRSVASDGATILIVPPPVASPPCESFREAVEHASKRERDLARWRSTRRGLGPNKSSPCR